MQNGDVEPYGRPRSEQVQKNSRPKANSPESDKDKADGSNSSLQEESGEPRGRETALANSSSATLRADRADSFCLLCRGGSISSFSSVGSGGGNRASGLSLEALQCPGVIPRADSISLCPRCGSISSSGSFGSYHDYKDISHLPAKEVANDTVSISVSVQAEGSDLDSITVPGAKNIHGCTLSAQEDSEPTSEIQHKDEEEDEEEVSTITVAVPFQDVGPVSYSVPVPRIRSLLSTQTTLTITFVKTQSHHELIISGDTKKRRMKNELVRCPPFIIDSPSVQENAEPTSDIQQQDEKGCHEEDTCSEELDTATPREPRPPSPQQKVVSTVIPIQDEGSVSYSVPVPRIRPPLSTQETLTFMFAKTQSHHELIIIGDMKRRLDQNELIFCPSFSIDHHGYKISPQIGLGTEHVSFYIALMRGESDKWPFTMTVFLRIINQSGGEHREKMFCHNDYSRFEECICDPKSAEAVNTAMGYPQFLCRGRLENEGYIRNDEVLLECFFFPKEIEIDHESELPSVFK